MAAPRDEILPDIEGNVLMHSDRPLKEREVDVLVVNVADALALGVVPL